MTLVAEPSGLLARAVRFRVPSPRVCTPRGLRPRAAKEYDYSSGRCAPGKEVRAPQECALGRGLRVAGDASHSASKAEAPSIEWSFLTTTLFDGVKHAFLFS
jgi:hypothetical protein